MRVAVLVDPELPRSARAAEVVLAIAEKHPGADIISAGMGAPVYAAERAALARGLRVAAFRYAGRAPTRGTPPEGDFVAPLDVVLHELLPGTVAGDLLYEAEPRYVGVGMGRAEATEFALRCADAYADETVIVSGRDEWPGLEGHRFQP